MKQQLFSSDRICALSDGIFAIAMTLLVLELKLPELEPPVTSEVFARGIIGQVPVFIAWIISFAMLCRLWIIHHGLMSQKATQTRAFLGLNFVFLGVVSFIPFPAALISRYSDQGLSVVIFSATYAVSGLAILGMVRIIGKEHLKASVDSSGIVKTAQNSCLWLLGTAVIACILAQINPRAGLYIWILFLFISPMVRKKIENKQMTKLNQ